MSLLGGSKATSDKLEWTTCVPPTAPPPPDRDITHPFEIGKLILCTSTTDQISFPIALAGQIAEISVPIKSVCDTVLVHRLRRSGPKQPKVSCSNVSDSG